MMEALIHNLDDILYLTLDTGLLFFLCFRIYSVRIIPQKSYPFVAALAAVFYKVLVETLDFFGLADMGFSANVRQENDILTFEVPGLSFMHLLVIALYCLIIVFIFTKDSRLLQIFTVALFIPLCDMLRVVSYYISRFILELWANAPVYLIRMILSITFLFALTWVFDIFFQILVSNSNKIYFVYLGVATVLLNVSVLVIKRNMEVSAATYTFVLILLLILLFFLFLERLIQNYNNSVRLQYQREIEENDRQTIQEIEEATDEVRKWRHEYQSQLMLFKSYCEDNQFQKLEQTLDELIDNFPPMEKQINTGNQELDLIINQKRSEARKSGIDMQIQIAIPEDLPYDRNDIFSLMNNLLNNALEAAVKTEAPFIRLTMHVVQNYLLIQIVNSCVKTSSGGEPDLKTQKDNRFLHGIGIPLIRSIAEKYGGMTYFSQEKDIFTSKVVLPLDDV